MRNKYLIPDFFFPLQPFQNSLLNPRDMNNMGVFPRHGLNGRSHQTIMEEANKSLIHDTSVQIWISIHRVRDRTTKSE